MKNAPLIRRTARSAWAGFHVMLILAMSAVVLFTQTDVTAAKVRCESSSVAGEAALDAAIAIFNAEAKPRCHKIILTADIHLTVPTRTIDNNRRLTGAWLVIDGAGFSVYGARGIRPFTIATRTDVTMKRITITEGDVLERDGGGIHNSGKLKLINSTVTRNLAEWLTDGKGGGIYNSGTLIVHKSAISGNYAITYGAGIYNSGRLIVTHSTIFSNVLSLHFGGGICNRNGTLTVANSTFYDNWSEYGGAIYNNGKLVVTRSRIYDNWSEFDGAVSVSGNSTAKITYCTIDGNRTVYAGGGVENNGMLTIMNSAIYGNSSAQDVGGINNEGVLTIINTTISGNTATESVGGISNGGKLVLTNSTVFGNEVELDGIGNISGISNNGELILNNSIIANSVNGADCRNGDNGSVDAFSSLIEDSEEMACNLIHGENGNLIGVDPLLGALQDNGGPTETHALLPQSPAIDAGDNALAVDPRGRALKTDQRGPGHPRIYSAGGTRTVDMGAFEAAPRFFSRRFRHRLNKE